MKRILIADASKASLVMTSEVFKDHFPGVQVVVARTSADAIELAKTCGEVDAFVVDFDLPDKDGAFTAARIKRFSQTPVLITAFDRPEVHDAIERELAAYEDCMSWMRKPVKADIVVSIAQRFCEGKYRTQRRLPSCIPAVVELVVNVKVNVAPAKTSAPLVAAKASVAKATAGKMSAAKVPEAKSGSKTKAVPATKTTQTVQQKIYLAAVVEDCSVGGVRVRLEPPPPAPTPVQKMKSKTQAASTQTVSVGMPNVAGHLADLQTGNSVVIHMPSLAAIESGAVHGNLDKNWDKDWAKNLAKDLSESLSKISPEDAKNARKKGATLPLLSANTKKQLAEKASETALHVFKGKLAWVTVTSDEDTGFGVHSDNASLSKKLFDVVASSKIKTDAANAQAAAAHAAAEALSKKQGRSHTKM